MPSITTWTRLEPRPRSREMREGLQASVHDPLWLLGRQWQVGEFQGEDAGSPCSATVKTEESRVSRYLPQAPIQDHSMDAKAKDYQVEQLSLEALVEGEPVHPKTSDTNYRLAAEAGLQFFRCLGSELTTKYRDLLLTHLALPALSTTSGDLDVRSQRFCGLVAGRVIDGTKLASLFPKKSPPGNISLPAGAPFDQIAVTDLDAFKKGLLDWLSWSDSLYGIPQDDSADAIEEWHVWKPERLEYSFSVSAIEPNKKRATKVPEIVLTAREYDGGRLDWSAVDVDGDPAHKLGATGVTTFQDITLYPTPIRFRGMPAARFWEFEDAGVDFASVDTAPEDLARLLFMEFAMIYGNDFFMIPVDLAVGTFCRISIDVADTFGEGHSIPSTDQFDAAAPPAKASWHMFRLATLPEDGHVTDFFFLPPVVGQMLEGPPIEHVLFMRDEMTNLAWAIEDAAQGPAGHPMRRTEVFRRKQQQELDQRGAPPSGPPEYHLFTQAPDYWNPLVMDGGGLLKLDGLQPVLGAVLAPFHQTIMPPSAAPVKLFDEEIPREGMQVTRSYQYARWIAGRTQLWIGREKRPGRGEGSSGLRYDVVEAAETP